MDDKRFMNLKAIQNKFHEELDAIYAIEEVDSFFYLLIDFYYQVKRIHLALDLNLEVDNKEPILYALSLLKKEKPIQYILEETVFFSLSFKVNEHTLIPRPETEELVDFIIKQANKKNEISILDIGTGSGCIAISLAKNLPNAKVYALDISEKALKMAKQNAKLNNVKVDFFQVDILNSSNLNHVKFDIIVSNPPYVRELEKQFMKPNVLDNEPHLALFVKDDNPLLFYKAITEFAVNNLSKNGLLFFEINEYLGTDMIDLLYHKNFSNIELKQDIFKKDRMIKGVLNK